MTTDRDKIVILTPVKNGERFIETYLRLLLQLTYPHDLISVGLLESDSQDNAYELLTQRLPLLRQTFRGAELWKKDFDFNLPTDKPRWDPSIQPQRRAILAKSRNYLLFKGLGDADWALWLDVDVIEYPSDIIERLLAAGKDIVQPHCVIRYGGESFDLNAWYDKGKYHIHDLRGKGDLVRLHAVGGTMLLVKADIHREGLIFPPFLYGRKNPLIRKKNYFISKKELLKTIVLNVLQRRPIKLKALFNAFNGEIETEGLGVMAHDMGYECWAMPNLEILHADF